MNTQVVYKILDDLAAQYDREATTFEKRGELQDSLLARAKALGVAQACVEVARADRAILLEETSSGH